MFGFNPNTSSVPPSTTAGAGGLFGQPAAPSAASTVPPTTTSSLLFGAGKSTAAPALSGSSINPLSASTTSTTSTAATGGLIGGLGGGGGGTNAAAASSSLLQPEQSSSLFASPTLSTNTTTGGVGGGLLSGLSGLSGLSAAVTAPTTATGASKAETTTVEEVEKAALAALQRERVADALRDWEKRLSTQFKDFGKFAKMAIQLDSEILRAYSNLEMVRKEQLAIEDRQSALDASLDQVDAQHVALSQLLDRMEGCISEKRTPNDQYPLPQRFLSMAGEIEHANRQTEELSKDLSVLQDLVYPSAMGTIIEILNMHQKTLDEIGRQTALIKHQVDAVDQML